MMDKIIIILRNFPFLNIFSEPFYSRRKAVFVINGPDNGHRCPDRDKTEDIIDRIVVHGDTAVCHAVLAAAVYFYKSAYPGARRNKTIFLGTNEIPPVFLIRVIYQ